MISWVQLETKSVIWTQFQEVSNWSDWFIYGLIDFISLSLHFFWLYLHVRSWMGQTAPEALVLVSRIQRKPLRDWTQTLQRSWALTHELFCSACFLLFVLYSAAAFMRYWKIHIGNCLLNVQQWIRERCSFQHVPRQPYWWLHGRSGSFLSQPITDGSSLLSRPADVLTHTSHEGFYYYYFHSWNDQLQLIYQETSWWWRSNGWRWLIYLKHLRA